jgi:hypothetical protein
MSSLHVLARDNFITVSELKTAIDDYKKRVTSLEN